MTDAEDELADLAGLVGEQRRKHCGRAAGPRLVWEPALGATARPRLFVNRTTSTWRNAAAALHDITMYHRKVHHRAALGQNDFSGTHAVAVAAARRLSALRFRAIADDVKLGRDYAQCQPSPTRTDRAAEAGRLVSGNALTPILRDWLIDIAPSRLNDPSICT